MPALLLCILAFLFSVTVLPPIAMIDAHGHFVRGGFSPRQPDMTLALPMLAAASFGIIAVVVRRISIFVGVALVVGSLIGFALVNFELTRLGYLTDALDNPTRLYYDTLQYSVGGFIIALVGGLVFVAYCMIARRPLRKRCDADCHHEQTCLYIQSSELSNLQCV